MTAGRPLKADPTKPYKAIASAVVACLIALTTTYAEDVPRWAIVVAGTALAGLLTYVVKNPQVPDAAGDAELDPDGL